MFRKFRPGPLGVLAVVLIAWAVGCSGPSGVGERRSQLRRLAGQPDRTEAELRASVGWIDHSLG